MLTRNLIGILGIPQSGPAFCTVADGAKTVAAVLLAPGEGLSKNHRRAAEAHEYIGLTIRADLGRSVSPDEFDRTTLLWALRSADAIATWSAPFPESFDELGQEIVDAAAAGRRFQTTIETNPQDAPTWYRWAQKWKRKTAQVRVYGPVIRDYAEFMEAYV